MFYFETIANLQSNWKYRQPFFPELFASKLSVWCPSPLMNMLMCISYKDITTVQTSKLEINTLVNTLSSNPQISGVSTCFNNVLI